MLQPHLHVFRFCFQGAVCAVERVASKAMTSSAERTSAEHERSRIPPREVTGWVASPPRPPCEKGGSRADVTTHQCPRGDSRRQVLYVRVPDGCRKRNCRCVYGDAVTLAFKADQKLQETRVSRGAGKNKGRKEKICFKKKNSFRWRGRSND